MYLPERRPGRIVAAPQEAEVAGVLDDPQARHALPQQGRDTAGRLVVGDDDLVADGFAAVPHHGMQAAQGVGVVAIDRHDDRDIGHRLDGKRHGWAARRRRAPGAAKPGNQRPGQPPANAPARRRRAAKPCSARYQTASNSGCGFSPSRAPWCHQCSSGSKSGPAPWSSVSARASSIGFGSRPAARPTSTQCVSASRPAASGFCARYQSTSRNGFGSRPRAVPSRSQCSRGFSPLSATAGLRARNQAVSK